MCSLKLNNGIKSNYSLFSRLEPQHFLVWKRISEKQVDVILLVQRIHSDFIHLLGRSPNITLSLNISTEGKLIEPAILTFHYKATVFSWQKHFRMLRMLETGLVTQWGKQNEQQPLRHEQCLDSSKSQNNNKQKEDNLVRISLANYRNNHFGFHIYCRNGYGIFYFTLWN